MTEEKKKLDRLNVPDDAKIPQLVDVPPNSNISIPPPESITITKPCDSRTELSTQLSDQMDLFSDDVLMQGILQKRGKNGLHMWKQRYFVLRGQTLYYYKLSGDKKCGQLKGQISVLHAIAKVCDSTLANQFSIELHNDTDNSTMVRDLAAPDEQTMSDWIAAINAASGATVMEPAAHLTQLDQSRTTRVILIRHGQYHTLQPSAPDVAKSLTEIGYQQADLTGQYLAEYLKQRKVNERFTQMSIYHSDLTRAIQTAKEIAKHFPNAEMHQNILIREAWPCAPLPYGNRAVSREKKEMMLADASRLKVAFRTFFKHISPRDFRRPSVKLEESKVDEFRQTFDQKNTTVRIGDRYRVIVCHANIIRWFVCTALGIDPEGTWGRMRYNHCGITEIDIDSMGFYQLGYLNQISHLPSHLNTET